MTTTMTLDLQPFIGDKQVEAACDAMQQVPSVMGARHAPLSHFEFYDAIQRQFEQLEIVPLQTTHALYSKNEVYFGMSEIQHRAKYYSPIVAWRASHNQRVSATLYVGAGMPHINAVCLNNAIKVTARQTVHFHNRLETMVHGALAQATVLFHHQQSTFARFRDTELTDAEAECAIIEMIRRGIIAPSKAGFVIDQWDTLDTTRLNGVSNVWRLFGAAAS
ncbi:MAG: hypothetical protein KAG66_21360, partial [Methylococcales bacterium]|nr:hypothetical protein [Methylococcales bacterium]